MPVPAPVGTERKRKEKGSRRRGENDGEKRDSPAGCYWESKKIFFGAAAAV